MSGLPQQEVTALNIEMGELTPVVDAYMALQSHKAELGNLESLLHGGDEDLQKLAREEKQLLEKEVFNCLAAHQ
jgi:hypothetical protein